MSAVCGSAYEAEQSRLADDPVIHELADEIADGPSALTPVNETEFTLRARHEYVRRGGCDHESVGGPAEAVRRRLATYGIEDI